MNPNIKIFEINHDLADIWIASEDNSEANYAYGGTRIVDPFFTNNEVIKVIKTLLLYESSIKNRLINIALKQGILSSYKNEVPKDFLTSIVCGGRCIIRPKNQEIASILKNPEHPKFDATILLIFERIGIFLNQNKGKIKLTPDFGRFAGLADILAKFTDHVLGISCEDGGCGGKSSYSSTGIKSAIETININNYKNMSVTLIGSAGALGTDILKYFIKENFNDIKICDLVYDEVDYSSRNKSILPDININKLPSKNNIFTEQCLMRGGLLVATTVGGELEKSNWKIIPKDTILFLAHNMAIPIGEEGIRLMQTIEANGVFALPGQLLTLGGALTSRLEWFWRQSKSAEFFDKELAHLIVKDVVRFLVSEIQSNSEYLKITPYEAMLNYSHFQNLVYCNF